MNAIISKGGKAAHVQLPVGRRQLAGALAYLGEYHANEYDLAYNVEPMKASILILRLRMMNG